MNTKLFLTAVTLVALLAGFIVSSGLDRSSNVTAQEQVVALRPISVENEPAIQMWSGPIQFADGNAPDFKPHIQTSAQKAVAPECMADEQATPRRQSGCIQ